MNTLTLRRSLPPSPSYMLDAIPHGYDEATRVNMLAMPGVTWQVDRSVVNGRGHFRGPAEAVDIAASVLESAGVVQVRRIAPEHSDLGLERLVTDVERPDLRDYQREGVAWIRYMLFATGAALLADDMRLGKTAQAIVAVDDIPGRVLVVCPAIVVPNWQREITKWGTRFGNEYDWAGDGPRTKAEVESMRSCHRRWDVMSYETFAKRQTFLPSYAVVILDEIHYASNGKSKRSEALREFLEPTTDGHRPFVLGLSGTPMTTRPRDLWHPLELLWPGRFGGFWQFTKRYADGRYVEIPGLDRSVWLCEEKEGLCKGRSHEAELQVRLSHVMLRRTKTDVKEQVPMQQRIMIDVPTKFDLGVMPLGDASSAFAAVGDALARAEELKLDAAVELANECLANGSRPLLFTLRRATAVELGKRLLCPVATGDDDASERTAILVGPEDSDAPAVATIASVTTGIDLSTFDVAIFVGLDWVPSTVLQAEARLLKIGASNQITYYYLIALGSVDEYVRDRVIDRLDTFAAIVGSDDTMATTLKGGTEDEILASIVAAVLAQ